MRRESLQLVALAATASFAFQGVGLAQDQEDRNARFRRAIAHAEQTDIFQTIKQETNRLSVDGKEAAARAGNDPINLQLVTDLERASGATFAAFNRTAQGGAVVSPGAVSAAIGAAVAPEVIRRVAPNIPAEQRPKVGALLEKIPEVKQNAPTIDQIFVPPPAVREQQQAKDESRIAHIIQTGTQAVNAIVQSVQTGGARMCILDK
jgi:hypothetical protein